MDSYGGKQPKKSNLRGLNIHNQLLTSDKPYSESANVMCICQQCPDDSNNGSCCQSDPHVKRKLSASNEVALCITDITGFSAVALNKDSLFANLVILSHYEGNPTPKYEEMTNEGLRYSAYKAVSAWLRGRLGAGNRRRLPACIERKIRSTFPSASPNEYTGFKECWNIANLNNNLIQYAISTSFCFYFLAKRVGHLQMTGIPGFRWLSRDFTLQTGKNFHWLPSGETKRFHCTVFRAEGRLISRNLI